MNENFTWLKKIVDGFFETMAKSDSHFLMMHCGEIPKEMLDPSIASQDDWKGWKPIKSIITDEDIDKFEKKIGHPLPASYRHFLKYKHFVDLHITDFQVGFHSHLPDKELPTLQKLIFDTLIPELIHGRNYIYFADFSDHGLLCFDANEPKEDNEYRIVYIFHEDLDDIHLYANNFRELLEADQERGNRFIEELNEYYSQREQ